MTQPCSFCGNCETPEHCAWSVTCPVCGAEPLKQCQHSGGGIAPLHRERWDLGAAELAKERSAATRLSLLKTGVMGVMAVDPGSSSGVAWAMVPTVGSTISKLACRYHYGSETVTGAWLDQGKQIGRLYQAFREWAYTHQRSPAYLVIEDFVLRKLGSSDPEGLSAVRVAAAIMGYRLGRADGFEDEFGQPASSITVTFQSPSDAKNFATSARLKRWGLWVVGKDHERDAWRHLATFVARHGS